MQKLFILGAPDYEMVAIEQLLKKHGQSSVYAYCGGARVHPGNMYKFDSPSNDEVHGFDVVCIECRPLYGGANFGGYARIDHHAPGDPGFGPDGRRKVVLGGATTLEAVHAFMTVWAPAQGLVNAYGDPARGFAGAYYA